MEEKCSPYLGYAKLEPVGNDDWAWLVFPLNESASFKIGTDMDCDLLLPSANDNVPIPDATLHVDDLGKISLENTSIEWTCGESLIVGGEILRTGDSCKLTEKTAVSFGSYTYSFQFTDTPTARYLKSLFDTVKCGVCMGILEEPWSFSCSHTFCQRCISSVVDSFLTECVQSPQLETTANPVNPSIECPTCRVKIPISTLSEVKNFKALAEVTKTIRELNDDRAFCVQCSNKRCMMHGSDYVYCRTCEVVLCPLCAMDGHRKHDLGSNYVHAFRNGRDFSNKCSLAKQEWMDILEQLERKDLKVRQALISVDNCVGKLTGIEQELNECTKTANMYFDEIGNLQALRWNAEVDVNRNNVLSKFEEEMAKISPSMDHIIDQLNAKADFFLNPQAVVDPSLSSQSIQICSSNSGFSLTSSESCESSASPSKSH